MSIIKDFSYDELTKLANIEKKVKKFSEKQNGLTQHEVQLLLEWVINHSRTILANSFGVSDIENLDLQGLCKVGQTIIYKTLVNIGLTPKCLTISNILDNYEGEDHKLNIVNFPMIDEISKAYLLDITYRQFLEQDYIPEVINYWNNDLERKKLLTELVRNGYLEFTPGNATLYAMSFLFTSDSNKQYEETLINEKTKERYFLAFIEPSNQDAFPYYDDEYLEYYYGFREDDFKTPLMIISEERDNKEKQSWELQSEEIAKIQEQSTKIAEFYRKQHDTQTSVQEQEKGIRE